MFKILGRAAMLLALGSCTASVPPDPVADLSVAEAGNATRSFATGPYVYDYTSRKPTGPRSWRQLNQEQTR